MAKRKSGKSKQGSAMKFDILGSAQQIWLAGLGAFARAQEEGPKLFQNLVTEGEKLQSRAGKVAERAMSSTLETVQSTVGNRMTEVTDKAQETWDNIEKMFQSRVQKAMHQLGVPTAGEINTLTRKVEELTDMVEELSQTRTAPKRTHTAKTTHRQRSTASTRASAAV